MTKYIKPLALPLLALAAINLAPLLIPIPVFLQLLLNASLTLHVGCVSSVRLGKASYKEINQCEEDLKSGNRSVTGWKRIWEIVQYPALGCVVLLALYFLIKNTQQNTLSIVLDLLFICSTTIYGSNRLNIFMTDAINGVSKKYSLGTKLQKILQFSSKYVLCPVFVASLCLLYTIQRWWLLNNLFALFFAITALKQTSLKSFTIVVPALWLLFLYDLYWVYRSDVMVTVAKGIDLPLKLLFPYIGQDNERGLSILGLGDIIVPGLFASLCLKYDVDNCILGPDKPTKFTDFNLPLYYVALGLYALGLVLTYTAMFVFSHPQPALVFIVPCLTMSLLLNKCFGSRLSLREYNSDAMAKNNQNSQII